MFHLSVVADFGAYVRGQIVTVAAEIEAILSGENAHSVVKIPPVAVATVAAVVKEG